MKFLIMELCGHSVECFLNTARLWKWRCKVKKQKCKLVFNQCSLIAPHMFWIASGRSLSSSKDFALTRPVSTRNGGSFVGRAAIPLGGNGFFQGMFQSVTDLLMNLCRSLELSVKSHD
jgi:hypothetical protein